ncbi:MAG: hypothetical protein FOGNACKC_02531 [Anaerolineae bacterium]|nr:hypothetical protein [Anaerolineae bacterium]
MFNFTTQQKKKQGPRWGLGLVLLALFGVGLLASLLFFQDQPGQRFDFIPVNLHSRLQADYSPDPRITPVPAVNMGIIWAAIRDREPNAADLQDRQSVLESKLLTPVPTVTPAFFSCQGIHFVYAGQDSWIDSADPAVFHGEEPLLQLGQAGGQRKQLLLYFPLNDVISNNTLIHSARLEMDVEQVTGSLPPNALSLAGLNQPFSEIDTNWANQPASGMPYNTPLVLADSVHAWDVTDIVRDWLSGRLANVGLTVAPRPGADFLVTYYSREVITDQNQNSFGESLPVGPRLVINCGGQLPKAVALNPNTPTPTPTPSQPPAGPNPAQPTDKPLPTLTAIAIPTLAVPSPAPTVPLPVPTRAPVLPPPTAAPTSLPPPSPPPTSVPPTSPPPTSPSHPEPKPTATPQANLALNLSASPNPITAGNRLTYTLTMSNSGPNNATNVILTDTLPPGVSLVSAASSQGSGCSGDSPVLCNLGTVAGGSVATVTIVVNVDPATTGTLTNTAAVSAREFDTNVANNTATAVTLVDSQADVQLTKTDSADPIVAGSVLTYTLTVANAGPSLATGVVLTDTLSASTTFRAATPGCLHSAGVLTCNLGTLSPGSNRVITVAVDAASGLVDGSTIFNTATATAAEPDPTPANNSATQPTGINKVADLALTKSDNPDPVVAGQLLTYTLAVTNYGPSTASGVAITDTLPAGVAVAAAPGCGLAGGNLVCNIPGSLPSGAGVQRTIVVTVGTGVSGSISNQALVAGAEADPAPANNTALESTLVNAVADLALTKSVSNAAPNVGDTIVFTVTVSNSGPSDAAGVTVSDPLPGGYTLASALPTAGSYSGASGTWSIGTIGVNSTVTLTLAVAVNASGVYTNTAQVQSSLAADPDSTPGDNSNGDDDDATVATTPVPVADISLSKSALPEPVVAGEVITYTLTVTNAGPSDAPGVVLTDTLPLSLTLAGATPSPTNQAGQTVSWDLGTAPAGSSQTIILSATVDSALAGGPITNTAVASSPTFDPLAGNNSAAVASTVTTRADLLISKSASPEPVAAGELLTYTLTITNAGPSLASGVLVTDTLPGGVVFNPALSSAGCTESAGLVTCPVGNLSRGSAVSHTVGVTVAAGTTGQLVNTAVVGGDQPDPASANNTAVMTTAVTVETDLSLVKSGSPEPVVAGEVITYTLTVTNNGPSDAQTVAISDTLPAGVAVISVDPITSGQSGRQLDWLLPGLGQGATGVITVVVGVDSALAGGPITNTAVVTVSAATDLLAANNTAAVTTTVAVEADLQISKSALPEPVVAGEIITYMLTITNAGPSDAPGVVVTDTLPLSLTLVGATPSPTGQAGQTVSWNLGAAPAGSSQTIILSATVDSALAGGPITNTAVVTGGAADPLAANNTAAVTTTVAVEADLQISKSAMPDPVVAGEIITYTLTITNAGPSDAPGVVVTDTLPLSLTLVGATPSPTGQAGQTVSWNLGAAPVGSSQTIILSATVDSALAGGPITNTAVVTGGTADPLTGNNTAAVTTTVAVEADLQISKSAAPEPVAAGEVITYTLTITNAGPSDAPGVALTDTLPLSLTLVGATPSPTGQAGQTVSWNLGTAPAGSSQTVILSATVDSAYRGLLTNTVSVTSATPDPNPAGNSASAVTAVVAAIDLALQKAASPEPVVAGNLLTYTLTITNGGPSTANGVVISDTLPAGVTVASAAGCGQSSGVVTCTLGAVPMGSSISRTVVVTVGSGVSGSLANTAVVSGTETDVASGNNTAAVTTTVAVEADLLISKSAAPEPVVAGEIITYTLTLTNAGPSDAPGVALTDTLPLSLTLVGATPSPTGLAGQTVSWNLGAAPVGSSQTIILSATVDSALAGGPITNTAVVTGGAADPLTGNNSATAVSTVVTRADLAISKSGSPAPAIAGQPLTYTLVITNNGPSAANGVVVTETLPLSVTFSGGSVAWQTVSANRVYTYPLGSLASGASRILTLTVSVDPGFVGVLTNTAALTGTTADPGPAANSATITTSANIPADVQLSKTAQPEPVIVGQPLTYTLLITNTGPVTATNVLVTDTLPAGVNFGSVTASQGSCSESAGVVTCNLGSLPLISTPLASSTFDTNNDGWATTVDAVGNPIPSYSGTGGNPGGYIYAVDGLITTGWYFVAPAKFRGNQAAAYLGSLEFDLRLIAGLGLGFPLDGVVMTGGGLTLAANVATPASTWTHYRIPLAPANWVDKADGQPPTSAELLSVLSNLTDLRIRGEYITLVDTEGLDNVVLNRGPAVVTIVVTPAIAATVVNTATAAASEPDLFPANNSGSASSTSQYGLSINPVTVTEGDSGPVAAVFTVTLSSASSQPVAVNYATADGTATLANNDYNPISGTLNFPPGTTVQTVTVQVNGDTQEEADEVFLVTLSNPINAGLINDHAAGTIINDDNDPALLVQCFNPVKDTFFRGKSNESTKNYGTDATFEVDPDPADERRSLIVFNLNPIPTGSTVLSATLSLYEDRAVSGQTVTVHQLTNSWDEIQATWLNRIDSVPWTTPGGDFDPTVVASFAPQVGLRQIDVTSAAASWVSGTNYGLLLRATGPSGSTRFRSNQTATASDRPQLCMRYSLNPALSISDATVTEGNSGTVDAIFTVTLSVTSAVAINVDYATASGSATGGVDFVNVPTTGLVFPPGVQTRTLTVTVNSDVQPEVDETFFVNLSNPSGATIADGQGMGTILDDDNLPAAQLVQLTAQKDSWIQRDSPNQNKGADTSLNVRPKEFAERNSLIWFDLGSIPPGSRIISATLDLFQTDGRDSQTVKIHRALADWTQLEVTWNERTAGIPWATPGGDFDPTVVASFPTGSTNNIHQIIPVTSLVQSWLDGAAANYGFLLRATTTDKTETITFRSLDHTVPAERPTLRVYYVPAGADLGLSKTVNTASPIVDDVITYTLTAVNNGPFAATTTVVTDTLPLSVTYVSSATTQGSYQTGSGVWAIGGLPAGGSARLTITARVTPSTSGAPIINSAVITAPQSDLTPANNAASVTITPTLPGISVLTTTVIEGDSGTTNAVFTVTLSSASPNPVSVNYTTVDNTTTAGSDYLAASGTLNFPAGTLVQTFTVVINGDTVDEADETFVVVLSAPVNAVINVGTAEGTIIDDDTAGLTLTTSGDSWIDYNNPTSNFAGDTEMQIDPQGGGRMRALLKFDLTGVPTTSTVISASLVVTVNNTQTGHTINIYRVITDWVESSVTWNTPWATPGGDYDSGMVWGSYSPDVSGQQVISLTALVQGWVSGTYTNYGVILNGTGASGTSTIWDRAAGNGNEATLVVEYNALGSSSISTPLAGNGRVFLPILLKHTAHILAKEAERPNQLFLPVVVKEPAK